MSDPHRDRSGPGALLSFDEARALAFDLVTPLDRRDDVALDHAAGRTLAVDIRAPLSLPSFDQAAMDGYAVATGGMTERWAKLPVWGCARAGDAPQRLQPGTACRIFTGAVLPSGADAVVMQEKVTRTGDDIEIACAPRPGLNIRKAGEDVGRGTTVLNAGHRLDWPDIALLAALGFDTAPVSGPLRIGLLTTGSELRGGAEPLEPGSLHDSNGPMLAALLAGPDVEVTRLRVRDNTEATIDALSRVSAFADLLVTTAGMSVGKEDHVRDAVSRLGGTLAVSRVAMKPGKPLGLGRIGRTCFVGLPGNPQAAAVGALAFIRPMVERMLGRRSRPLSACIDFAFSARPGRTEVLPVRLRLENDRLVASRCLPEGSHRLTPMVAADAFAILAGSSGDAAAGRIAEILPVRSTWLGA